MEILFKKKWLSLILDTFSIENIRGDKNENINASDRSVFPLGKCCHGRNRNNIQQENTSMEILEIKERKMKNRQRKEQ